MEDISYGKTLSGWGSFTYRAGEGSGAFGKVTNMQDGVRATWSRIRKAADGAGLAADMQGSWGKR